MHEVRSLDWAVAMATQILRKTGRLLEVSLQRQPPAGRLPREQPEGSELWVEGAPNLRH